MHDRGVSRLNRVDKAALDYLLECASQIGFGVEAVSTSESKGELPTVTITFLQKIMTPPPANFAGVTEEQAKEIAQTGKLNLHVPSDKMATLEEDPED